MGFQATTSYPMGFAVSQLGPIAGIIAMFFLQRIVRSGPIVGGNYLSFVVLGVIGQSLVGGAFQGVGIELDAAIQQGRLEMLLIEPIRWPTIPAALGLWPIILSCAQVTLTLCVGIGLGMHISLIGALCAVPLAAAASLSGLGVGVLAGSVRVLAKRSDPVWLIYSIVSGLVGGIAVPINLLPLPLRGLSWCLPTMYVNSGLRKLMMPHAQGIYGPNGLWATVVMWLALVPLATLATIAFNRSVNVGRRLGVLAGY